MERREGVGSEQCQYHTATHRNTLTHTARDRAPPAPGNFDAVIRPRGGGSKSGCRGSVCGGGEGSDECSAKGMQMQVAVMYKRKDGVKMSSIIHMNKSCRTFRT